MLRLGRVYCLLSDGGKESQPLWAARGAWYQEIREDFNLFDCFLSETCSFLIRGRKTVDMEMWWVVGRDWGQQREGEL